MLREDQSLGRVQTPKIRSGRRGARERCWPDLRKVARFADGDVLNKSSAFVKAATEDDHLSGARRSARGRSRGLVFAMTTAAPEGGGIAAVNRMLIPILVEIAEERRFELTIVSLEGTTQDRAPGLPEPIAYHGCDGRRSVFALELLRRVPERPLYFFERVGLSRPLLPLAAVGLARTVIFAHGTDNWRMAGPIIRLSLRASSLVMTNSHYTMRRMREHKIRAAVAACPLGLSSSFRLRDLESPLTRRRLVLQACDGGQHELGERVLLLVGRLDPREGEKGHATLIAALPEILTRHRNVQLVCPGPGEHRAHLSRLAMDHGVASSVFLPGFVPTSTLEQLYEQCYALVMPSSQEGFGLVYLEAMNYAKPCVGCRGDGAEDVIEHGETGYLLRRWNDRHELVCILDTLLDDPMLAQTLGRNGLKRLHAYFTTAQFRSRFKALLTPVL